MTDRPQRPTRIAPAERGEPVGIAEPALTDKICVVMMRSSEQIDFDAWAARYVRLLITAHRASARAAEAA